MDQQKLRSLVFDKTGIKVDSDDPIFALVALNEAVLAETVERHLTLLDNAARELALQAQAVAAGAPRPPPPSRLENAGAAPAAARSPASEWRLLAAAAALSVLSALLVLAGQALLAPSSLTPAQLHSIRQGEKLALAVQKLDPKSRALLVLAVQKLDPESRALIDAELQKP